MPKSLTPLQTCLHYWPILVAVAGLGYGAADWVIRHQQQDVVRDERLRVLEAVVVSEHPGYTLMIYP